MSQNPEPRRHLTVINPDSAGIDIGSREIWVAIRADATIEGPTVRRFGTFTDDLQEILVWLNAAGVTTVCMESTGIYWIPLYDVLSAGGVQVCLVNPREIKQVPGRKSDLKDCQWLQELHAFGLLRASFRPDDAGVQSRAFVRQRQAIVDDTARVTQLIQKSLVQMNIRLPEVVTQVTGKTGMAIIRDILKGVRDPNLLSKHRDHRCKMDEATFGRALIGNWRREHLFALRQAVSTYDHLMKQIQEVEIEIERCLNERPDRTNPRGESGTNPTEDIRKPRNKSDFHKDIRGVMERKAGVDLTQIDGISETTATIVISEVGFDLGKFKTVGNFTSWIGLSPAHEISGGKVLRNGTKTTSNRIKKVLRMAALAAGRTKSALGEFFRRLAGRAGKSVAITATARKLAVIIYRMLTTGSSYMPGGLGHQDEKRKARRVAGIKRLAEELGLQVIVPQGAV